MSSLFIKRVGFSMVLGLASVQAMAASSDDFVEAATEAGIAEVVTGKLALEKTQNAEIKTFAQQMVSDHTKAIRNSATSLASSTSPYPMRRQ